MLAWKQRGRRGLGSQHAHQRHTSNDLTSCHQVLLLHAPPPAGAPVGSWFWRLEVPEYGFGICFASGEYWQPEELSQTNLTMGSNYILRPCGEGGSYLCLLGEQRRSTAANLSEVSKGQTGSGGFFGTQACLPVFIASLVSFFNEVRLCWS